MKVLSLHLARKTEDDEHIMSLIGRIEMIKCRKHFLTLMPSCRETVRSLFSDEKLAQRATLYSIIPSHIQL